MQKLLFVLVFLLSATICSAQDDSLFVSFKDDKWVIPHTVELGENLFLLSRRYHVPPAALADANGINYQQGLEQGTVLNIPLGGYNQLSVDRNGARKLYYRVGATDNLYRISRYAGVPQHLMQQWNGLTDNSITEGQTLFVGWLSYDTSQLPFSEKDIENVTGTAQKEPTPAPQENRNDTVIVIKIPPAVDSVSEAERDFMLQTNNGANIVEEKGKATFFNSTGKVKSSRTFFAFHNTAARGTIIKVHNPGTLRTIYVKVLGPLPQTKQYHNSIIGIGGGARKALGVTEDNAWCELQYYGY